MRRVVWLRVGVGGAAVVAVIVIVIAALVWFGGGSGEASEPISAPALTVAPAAAAEGSTTDRPEEPAESSASESTLFRIVPDESEVRFEIGEVLRGAPTTAIGATREVAGDIIVNFTNPAATEMGAIRINVRTLRTDEERRDRAIRSFILQSSRDQFEFAEFRPTGLVGLPSRVAPGDAFEFQIEGELTLRDITAPVVFDARAELVSDTRLTASATTIVQRGVFELTIPSVPFVASVEEDVVLGIDLVAVAVNE